MAGAHIPQEARQRAGVAAIRWWEENKDRTAPHLPPPPPPVQHDPAAAKRVQSLRLRLGLSIVQVAKEIGDDEVSKPGLGKWLKGKDTTRPSVQLAGVAAIQWWEQNKDRTAPPLTTRAGKDKDEDNDARWEAERKVLQENVEAATAARMVCKQEPGSEDEDNDAGWEAERKVLQENVDAATAARVVCKLEPVVPEVQRRRRVT